MKLIDILIRAAQLLGLEQESDTLKSTTQETESETCNKTNIKRLFELSKFSIQELCSNYLPVSNRTNITTTNSSFSLKDLTNYIRIQNVYEQGKLAKYKIINRNIVFEKDGEYTIEYFTYPLITSLFDELDFIQNFNPDVVVLGLCAYYCLAVGLFDEYQKFHDAYVERAESLKSLKVFALPSRRWE